ncbi:peptidylprolyl isomerase [Thermodesulfobacterium hydrogeniphilum]|uniref:peptidylprolyl isomerase n=1 Tax=Thermodesulfobacterium hydrogeniphilum TaxID=161156 RepID=UPI00057074B8|nr:peptidylprolyl isomerase [Thermodesulfobacterium hydrogeniphilum]
MRNVIFICILVLVLNLFIYKSGLAKDYLIKINDKVYTKEDFKNWWKYWKDKNTPFPETPEPFIEWILMAEEAKRMRLYESPNYKRKLDEFRKVRSLLWLKSEEIDSKIDLSDKRLWEEYVKNFTPVYKIYFLKSNKKEDILAWKKEISDIHKCQKFAKRLSRKNRAEIKNIRPWGIPESLKKVLKEAKAGDIIGPLKINKFYYLVCIEEKKSPSKEDFKKIKSRISYILRKKEESKLNKEFIEKLKKKYKVKVNEKILKAIRFPANFSEDFLNKTVIKIEDKTLPVRIFIDMLKREIWLRYHRKRPEDLTEKELERIKEFLVNSIIAQTLVDIEALNRKYEETKYKPLWKFYKKERLVKEFEAQVIWPRVKVSEKEMKEYYKKHKSQYYYPERVTIAIIRTKDKNLIKTIYEKIQRGRDFFTVAKDFGFRVVPQVYNINQLDSRIRKVVEKLNEEDISDIFKIGNDYCIVKLIDREPGGYYPYKMVKRSIKNILINKKFEKERKKIIDQLKKYAKIIINKKEWEKLKKEMANEK